MASGGATLETQHADMIHDAQFDYYGKRIATCSSDKVIKIFDVGTDANTHLTDLRGHEGPVWQVAWAHPKFGTVLASCSYDRKVLIWKETSANVWEIIHQFSGHELSVNSVSWAPHEYGLILACASSDGTVSILTYKEGNTWEDNKFAAHQVGTNAVSWCSAVAPSSLVVSAGSAGSAVAPRRVVSGGCDNLVKIWIYNEPTNKWDLEHTLSNHKDWVRDVSWAPNIGLPSSVIASTSQDSTVVIWTQEDPNANWTFKVLPKFPDVVWRASWSVTGNILAVASGDNKVSLWKESLDGEWKLIQSIDEATEQH